MVDFNAESIKHAIQHSSSLEADSNATANDGLPLVTTPDTLDGRSNQRDLRKVAFAVAGLGLAAAAALGIHSLQESDGVGAHDAGTPDKTSSASVQPGIGVPGYHDLENLNVRPSANLIKLAQTPVLAKDYTPDGALNRLLDFENVYFTSGLYDGSGETASSKKTGDKIYENIYGSPEMQKENQTTPAELGHDNVRTAVGREFGQFYTNDQSATSSDSVPATWRANCIETSLNMTSIDTLWYGTIECEVESNFHDIDKQYPRSAAAREVSIRLENVNGQYFMTYRK